MGSDINLKDGHIDKLGIENLKISEAINLIETNFINFHKMQEEGYDRPMQSYCMIGQAGVGKTAICMQLKDKLSRELNKEFNLIKINCSCLSRDDLLSPFPVIKEDKNNEEGSVEINGNKFTFRMLYSEFIPNMSNSYGVLIIDEFSRAENEFQQSMMQILNERMLHTYKLPDKWLIIATDNPDDENYTINAIQDAALLRRSAKLGVRCDVPDFIKYAKHKEFHPYVIGYISNNTKHLYDEEAMRKGMVYANPASWERVSDILWGFGDDVKNKLDLIESSCSLWLNTGISSRFRDYIEGIKQINPEDLFNNYNKVKPEILKHIKEKGNAVIGEVVDSFFNYLISYKPDFKKEGKINKKLINNCVNFLTDIPIDSGIIFTTNLKGLNRLSSEYLYLSDIIYEMLNYSKFNDKFHEEINGLCNEDE